MVNKYVIVVTGLVVIKMVQLDKMLSKLFPLKYVVTS